MYFLIRSQEKSAQLIQQDVEIYVHETYDIIGLVLVACLCRAFKVCVHPDAVYLSMHLSVVLCLQYQLNQLQQ